RQVVLEIGYAIGRTVYAKSRLPVTVPIAHEWSITRDAEYDFRISEYGAGADAVGEEKDLIRRTIHTRSGLAVAAPIARDANIAGDAEHHRVVSKTRREVIFQVD